MEWQSFDEGGFTYDFQYRYELEQLKMNMFLMEKYLNMPTQKNLLLDRNILCEEEPKEDLFVVVYKSKPIRRSCFRIMG